MTDSERTELEAVADVADVAADQVIAEAEADFADLALDAAAELEQDLELEEAIAEVAATESAVADEVSEGSPADEDPYREFKAELRRQP
ncbi:MAG: hypothetical protein RLZZ590_852, partial [Actinomycetota bacterium]